MINKFFIKTNNSIKPEYPIPATQIETTDLCSLTLQDGDKLCTHTEACLEVIHARLKPGRVKAAIELLKDKYAFRKAIRSLFPSFEFYQTTLENLKPVAKPMIIKPTKGFFSAGVRLLKPSEDLSVVKQELSQSLTAYQAYFSKEILSSDFWIVEDYLEGDELAVDMYYAEDGAPVILNITQHPIPQNTAYRNVIYWTHEDLFTTHLKALEEFFTFLNTEILHVTNFPIHAEFRLHNQQLVPIELNPLRFGGFGLGDLPYHTLHSNSYACFFENKKPRWQALWKQHRGKYFAWSLGYNGQDVDVKTLSPDYHAYVHFCGLDHLIHLRPLDWKTLPVFSISYLGMDSFETIEKILQCDFNQFFMTDEKLYSPYEACLQFLDESRLYSCK